MTISFYSRGATVWASISDGVGVRYRISTGLKISKPLKFVNGRFKGNFRFAIPLNDRLLEIKSDIMSAYAENKSFDDVKIKCQPKDAFSFIDNESTDLVELCKAYVNDASIGKILTKSKKGMADATVSMFSYCVIELFNFSSANGSIDLVDYTVDPRASIQDRREIGDSWSKYFNKFCAWLESNEVSERSRRTIMNCIQIIVNHYAEKLFLVLPKIDIPSAEDKPVIVLPPDFVGKFVFKTDLKDFSHDQIVTWEVCCMMLITTLRLGDALSLTPRDFAKVNDNYFLRKKNKKTGAYTEVPIPAAIGDRIEINSKFGMIYNSQPDKKIIYDTIKSVFAMYPEMHEFVSGYNGEQVKMYEIVHPHMLRKTAITTMIYSGVDPRHIKFASGHTQRSSAFEKYVGFVDRNFKSDIHNYYSAIGG